VFLKIAFDGFRGIKMCLANCGLLGFIIDNIVVITVFVWFHFLTTFCNLNQSPPEV
ncbi:unnamed protein product, partial [Brassica rapa subsp. trilocularis]